MQTNNSEFRSGDETYDLMQNPLRSHEKWEWKYGTNPQINPPHTKKT